MYFQHIAWVFWGVGPSSAISPRVDPRSGIHFCETHAAFLIRR